jgi:hypothetical protein
MTAQKSRDEYRFPHISLANRGEPLVLDGLLLADAVEKGFARRAER